MKTRIRFTQLIGKLAVIEGTIKLVGDRLEFELAMTESIKGPADGVITRSVKLADLESVDVSRRLFRKSKLEFVANNISAFNEIPGSKGFKYTVFTLTPHKEVVSFVREVLFEMSHLEMKRFSDELDQISNAGAE